MAPVGLQSVSSGEPSENRGALKQEGAALLNPRPLPSNPASDTGSPTYASHHAHPAGMPGQGPHHPSHTRPSVVCSPSKCRRVPSALPGPRFMLEGLSGEIWDGGRADLPAPLRCLVPAPAHPTFCPPVGLNDGPPELRSYQARGCQVGLGAAKEERNTLQPHTDLLTEVNLCPAPSTGAAGLRAE